VSRNALVAVCILLYSSMAAGQVFRPDPSLGYLPSLGGAAAWGGIYSKTMGGIHRIVVQVYDLKHCTVDALLFGTSSMGDWDGLYNPDPVNPCFRKMEHDSAFALYRALYGDRVIAVTNAAFFEAPSDSMNTTLSYPLILGGIVISAGGSPYGPISSDYPLKVLQISDSSVAIKDYDYRMRSERTDSPLPVQLVTLSYRNHPNVREFPQLREGYRNRYHLVSIVRRGSEPEGGTILIVSANYSVSIFELAGEMKRLCPLVRDDEILTLDGGSSISLQVGHGDRLIDPEGQVRVPMYLGFRLRTGGVSHEGEVHRIMNPHEGEVISSTHPYYVFYYSDDTKCDFELYQHNIFRSKLPNSAALLRERLFVLEPARWGPGDEYQLKMLNSSGRETCSGSFTIK
jgi:hypothetical protein